MSKTPLCDLRSARAYRGTYNEFIEVLEFARKLETDRAELAAMVRRLSATACKSGNVGHSIPSLATVNEARALLARLEADK